MPPRLPDELLAITDKTINDYALIRPGEKIIVALSGGKDSMLLCLALKELGYPYRPVTVDMGYQSGWAGRIADLAGEIGLSVEVVQTRNLRPGTSGDPTPIKLSRRIELLDSLDSRAASAGVTPCTHCYSVKVLALDMIAKSHDVSRVAFAHHMTDAAASLLKESLLQVDRFDRDHDTYRRANFEKLVDELAHEAQHDRPAMLPLTRRISELVDAASVDTDEPPRQPLRNDLPDEVEIIRPFFGVSEDVVSQTAIRLGIATEGSGCGHGMTALSETPREMVHHRVLAGRGQSPFFAVAERMVRHGVSKHGTCRVRSRHRRPELLGGCYKPTTADYDKL